MDNLDNLAPAKSDSSDLQAQILSLRQMVVFSVALVILLSGTVNLYLWHQVRLTSGESAQMIQGIGDYGRFVNSPPIQQFFQKLQEYSRTHPDFAPIVSKYNIGAIKPATAATSATSPQPAKTPPPSTKK